MSGTGIHFFDGSNPTQDGLNAKDVEVQQQQQAQKAAAPVQPTLANSQAALDEAAEQQRKAKGAAGTIFSQGGSLLGSGNPSTSKMLLGS